MESKDHGLKTMTTLSSDTLNEVLDTEDNDLAVQATNITVDTDAFNTTDTASSSVSKAAVKPKAKKRKVIADKETSGCSLSRGDMDATRLYLNEIGFASLLTAEEEVKYARMA